MMEMLLFLTYPNGPFKAEEVLGIGKSESMNLFQAGLSPPWPAQKLPLRSRFQEELQSLNGLASHGFE
jgi:hypothetical protein